MIELTTSVFNNGVARVITKRSFPTSDRGRLVRLDIRDSFSGLLRPVFFQFGF